MPDCLHHRIGYPSAGGKPTSHGGTLFQTVSSLRFQGVEIDLLCVKHPLDLLKGQHIVHI